MEENNEWQTNKYYLSHTHIQTHTLTQTYEAAYVAESVYKEHDNRVHKAIIETKCLKILGFNAAFKILHTFEEGIFGIYVRGLQSRNYF